MKRAMASAFRCSIGILLVGCAQLGAAQSGVQSVQSGADTAQQGVKSGEDKTKQNTAEAKDRAGNGGQASGGGGGAQDDPNGDPDKDSERDIAKEAKVGETLNDRIGKAPKDLVDWKKYQLDGTAAAKVTLTLRWDDPKADLNVELFDSLGENKGASPPKAKTPKKEIVQRIDPGLYYVKISMAPGSTQGTIYSFQLKWAGAPAAAPAAAAAAAPANCVQPSCGGPGAPACPPPGTAPNCGAAGQPVCCGSAAAAAAAAAPPAYPTADNPKHPRAHVVQSYRDDDGKMVLFLDRGSDAGFKVGQKGTLLLGKEGDTPLDGGGFTIIQVIDKQKAKAKSEVSSVGKNNRARIDLEKWPQ
jgi:hypothetical protein